MQINQFFSLYIHFFSLSSNFMHFNSLFYFRVACFLIILIFNFLLGSIILGNFLRSLKRQLDDANPATSAGSSTTGDVQRNRLYDLPRSANLRLGISLASAPVVVYNENNSF